MVRQKRIEAIRSQILSKLRLPKAPEPEEAGDKEDIPTTLLSLYNSTKDMLKEQQIEVQNTISPEQEEEEYFAKVLNRFNMTRRILVQPGSSVPSKYARQGWVPGPGSRELPALAGSGRVEDLVQCQTWH
ncbi:hypothetical protein GOODEAATRI_012527 [Goodea atripinnis]|uniref:TGF-beta propeptide domain-containing protein n=1 Tax=Goodea atripinnis TaxID=208336 RepID=A0ABV0PDM0_9TELE